MPMPRSASLPAAKLLKQKIGDAAVSYSNFTAGLPNNVHPGRVVERITMLPIDIFVCEAIFL